MNVLILDVHVTVYLPPLYPFLQLPLLPLPLPRTTATQITSYVSLSPTPSPPSPTPSPPSPSPSTEPQITSYNAVCSLPPLYPFSPSPSLSLFLSLNVICSNNASTCAQYPQQRAASFPGLAQAHTANENRDNTHKPEVIWLFSKPFTPHE